LGILERRLIVSHTHSSVDHLSIAIPPTLKANCSNPAVRPGSDWYLVPALARTASFVVGPATSLLATLMPPTSAVSYEKEVDPEAVEARPRRVVGPAQHCLRRASCAVLPIADREIIVRGRLVRVESRCLAYLEVVAELVWEDSRIVSNGAKSHYS